MACIHYVVMIHLNEQVRLVELLSEQVYFVCKKLTGNSQKLWTTYLFTKNNKIF